MPNPPSRRSVPWRRPAAGAAAATLSLAMASAPAAANQFLVCRAMDMASPLMSPLLVPASSLFRDNGRADDPLASFGNDRWQLRVETLAAATIKPLDSCVLVRVHIVSDSAVKSVTNADNRTFVYAGNYQLLDRPDESEELLSTRGRVLDDVH
nr:hypothetical protein [uncultured Rhodopila sp.]